MQRQSNIELLRIIAMSFILILHFLSHVYEILHMNPYVYQALVITNLCGVNLFVMISGYFGIKGSLQSFIKLFGLIIFISAITLLIGSTVFNMHLSVARIVKTFIMPFSVQYWFLACYLGLYILAPVLNKGLSVLTLQELRRLVIVLTFVSVFSCWYGQNRIGINGYSLFHFIYLYVLGFFIRTGIKKETKSHKWLLLAIVSISMNVTLTFIFDYYYGTFDNRYWNENALSYNNPFVILASASIFIWFSKLNMRNSATVNALASGALGCYLLQDGFIRDEIYSVQKTFILTHTVLETLTMFFFAFTAYWLVSFILLKVYNLGYKRILQSTYSQSFIRKT